MNELLFCLADLQDRSTLRNWSRKYYGPLREALIRASKERKALSPDDIIVHKVTQILRWQISRLKSWL